MYPKFLECSSQVTKSTSRIPRNNRAFSLKVYILSQFNGILPSLDNWECWQQMKDDEWEEDVGLDSFYNWSCQKPREELVMDFINGFVFHDDDEEKECRHQQTARRSNP
jgi:hypothetical protein